MGNGGRPLCHRSTLADSEAKSSLSRPAWTLRHQTQGACAEPMQPRPPSFARRVPIPLRPAFSSSRA
jgi:hypothetical protein